MVVFDELGAEVNEQFGFGSWDQYALVDSEFSTEEISFAEDVGEWFAGRRGGLGDD